MRAEAVGTGVFEGLRGPRAPAAGRTRPAPENCSRNSWFLLISVLGIGGSGSCFQHGREPPSYDDNRLSRGNIGLTVTTPQNHAPPGGVESRPGVIFSDDAGMLFCSVGNRYPCLFARKCLTVPGWATRLLAACGEHERTRPAVLLGVCVDRKRGLSDQSDSSDLSDMSDRSRATSSL